MTEIVLGIFSTVHTFDKLQPPRKNQIKCNIEYIYKLAKTANKLGRITHYNLHEMFKTEIGKRR